MDRHALHHFRSVVPRSSDDELQILKPDGSPFLSFAEMVQKYYDEKERSEFEWKREEQHKRAVAIEKAKVKSLQAKLRELGVDPDEIPNPS